MNNKPVGSYHPNKHTLQKNRLSPTDRHHHKNAPTITDVHKQNEAGDKLPFKWAFFHPKYWGIWLLLALLLPMVWLPLWVQFWLGRQLGIVIFKIAKRRQKDTLINLSLAFPQKSDDERFTLAKDVFINQGIGIFESLCAWLRPNVFVKCVTIEGLQHLICAKNSGKSVLLLGAHYTILDLGGRLFAQFSPIDCVYRPQNNPFLNWLIVKFRSTIYEKQIQSRDMRTLAARLQKGKVIWYTPDQDFGLNNGVMATFFGVPCATITAQRRLAKLNKKNPPAVIMIHMYRQSPAILMRGKRPHYHLSLTPINNYPSDDELADANHINALLATQLSKDLSQYMWFHRRFKTQTDGRNYYK